MIQDIQPHHLYNEYRPETPRPQDAVFCFQGRDVLLGQAGDGLTLPTHGQLAAAGYGGPYQYLFCIDDTRYFLLQGPGDAALPGYAYASTQAFRGLHPQSLCYAGVTATHLAAWYRDNRFCGRCGGALQHAGAERMLACPACGNRVYPKIAPAVIVGVTDGDRLLLSRYAGRPAGAWALIAGFTEIGETVEDTVRREVMEEVGLRVRNLRYYKSQPWGFASNLLLGFFCDLDGPGDITLDASELSEAAWYDRRSLPVGDDGLSLTRAMMACFARGEQP